ncbi:ferredoxin--NADP reductase [Indioceanicola profundi]|uniref:ferredoxin--NADP reductase n=1 Tax=Indioceanicola profundi TaxID=2220096 RepID=UPI000E6AA39B|nr:ferredoxin--NADP reductase [Indioceanicola profundi]
MSAFAEEKVISVHHWTDTLFSFKLTRDQSLRFLNGQFAMIGLQVEGKPLVRAYSMASANYEDHLEFFSIKVPNGPLTSRLQHIKVGDTVLVGRKPTGTLLTDNLRPGRNLYLFSTGTGLAPFMSLIRDPEMYGKFDKVILTHGVRYKAELAYQELITRELPDNEFFGDLVREKLVYYPTVTREPFKTQGRLTDLIHTGRMAADLGLPDLDPELDRAMICGGPDMLADLKQMLEERGFKEGSSNDPADFVVEKAFVEK